VIRAIDHIVIAVTDLAAATDDYAMAGFTVTPGGEHVGGATHNALISFADGSYFELIAFTDPSRPVEHRWWDKLATGEGTVDFAVLSDDLGADGDRLRAAGLYIIGPDDGGRQRPDGQRVAWRNLMLDGNGAALPFAIEDVTPHDLRVPPAPATDHRLAVERVAGLVVVAPDLDRAARLYADLFGNDGSPSAPTIEGATRAHRFGFGAQWVELVEPAPTSPALLRHARDRGAAPWEIVLAGTATESALLPLELAHGARIRVEGSDLATR
jgi:hypothetical protein